MHAFHPMAALMLLTAVLAGPVHAQDAAIPAAAPAAAASVEVPERLRIRLADLHWPVTELRDRKLREVWKKGDDTETYPASLGRIDATELVWKHKIHPVTSVTVVAKDDQDQPTAVRIGFELGSLEVRVHGRHPAESDATFTPLDGKAAVRFRTGGNWGSGNDMLEEAASAPPPPSKP